MSIVLYMYKPYHDMDIEACSQRPLTFLLNPIKLKSNINTPKKRVMAKMPKFSAVSKLFHSLISDKSNKNSNRYPRYNTLLWTLKVYSEYFVNMFHPRAVTWSIKSQWWYRCIHSVHIIRHIPRSLLSSSVSAFLFDVIWIMIIPTCF